MRAVDLIKSSLAQANGYAEALFRDIADEPLIRAVPGNGPHAYWLLGHLVVSGAAALDQYLLGRPNRHEVWRPMFGIGTVPMDDIGDGPSYGELLEAFESMRVCLLEYAEGLRDDDLDRLCCANDWPGPVFGSVGECLIATGIHIGIHAGQVACIRRAAGRSLLML